MKRPLPSFLLALGALTASQAVQAQQACVAAADVDDTVLYAMPIAYDATMAACAATYSEDGFMKSEGPAFAESFRVKQDAAWPGAYRSLKVFVSLLSAQEAENGAGNAAGELDMIALLDALPPESLRPLVDAFLQQKIAGEIKAESCDKIERGVTLLAPLPAENVSGLVTFIAEIADVKNPEICSSTGVGPDELTETPE